MDERGRTNPKGFADHGPRARVALRAFWLGVWAATV